MAGKKEIRVMFFYSDEAVFDKVKKWKTRDRLVQWADQFYARYGYVLNTNPLPWSESVYKRLFCLDKTNGLRGYSFMPEVNDLITTKIEHYKVLIESVHNAYDTATAESDKEYRDDLESLTKLYEEHNAFLQMQLNQEIKFRNKIQERIKKDMSFKAVEKDFVHVVFCDFVDKLADVSPMLEAISGIDEIVDSIQDTTVALTLKQELDKLLMFTEKGKKDKLGYIYPLVIIDVNGMTKSMNYVLAHELVHAAGGFKRDNTGTPGNIMIYKDSEGKQPTQVHLDERDQKLMELAFFVV